MSFRDFFKHRENLVSPTFASAWEPLIILAGYFGNQRSEREKGEGSEGVILPAQLGQVSENEFPGRETTQRDKYSCLEMSSPAGRLHSETKQVSENGFLGSARETTQR